MHDAFLKSTEFLEKHLTDPISLDDIASAAHVSQRQLLRYYQTLLKTTIKDYVRERRLTQASHDLVQTDKRITDLALDYQFNSLEGFTRSFHRCFGRLPSSHRKINTHLCPAQMPSLCDVTLELYLKHFQLSSEKVFLPQKRILGLPLDVTDEGMPTEYNQLKRISTSQMVKDRINAHGIKVLDQWMWEINFRIHPKYEAGNTLFIGVEIPEADCRKRNLEGLKMITIPAYHYMKFVHDHTGENNYRLIDQMRITSHITIKWQQRSGLFFADHPILTRASSEEYDQTRPYFELFKPYTKAIPQYEAWWQFSNHSPPS